MKMLYTDVMTADYIFCEDDNGAVIDTDLDTLLKLTQKYYSDKVVTSVAVIEQFSSFEEDYGVDESGDQYVRCAHVTVTFEDGSSEQVQWNCYI